jgi:hypothetical protein
MARPIKDTPVLMGKEAKRFSEEARANETKKISESDYKKMMDNYRQLKG